MDETIDVAAVMVRLVRAAAVDPVLAKLAPRVIEPDADAHPAQWRQSWIAWQDVRGLGADLISPPDHYKPNPYWAPNQIRLWAYNRAALLLVDAPVERAAEISTLLLYLGLRP